MLKIVGSTILPLAHNASSLRVRVVVVVVVVVDGRFSGFPGNVQIRVQGKDNGNFCLLCSLEFCSEIDACPRRKAEAGFCFFALHLTT